MHFLGTRTRVHRIAPHHDWKGRNHSTARIAVSSYLAHIAPAVGVRVQRQPAPLVFPHPGFACAFCPARHGGWGRGLGGGLHVHDGALHDAACACADMQYGPGKCAYVWLYLPPSVHPFPDGPIKRVSSARKLFSFVAAAAFARAGHGLEGFGGAHSLTHRHVLDVRDVRDRGEQKERGKCPMGQTGRHEQRSSGPFAAWYPGGFNFPTLRQGPFGGWPRRSVDRRK